VVTVVKPVSMSLSSMTLMSIESPSPVLTLNVNEPKELRLNGSEPNLSSL